MAKKTTSNAAKARAKAKKATASKSRAGMPAAKRAGGKTAKKSAAARRKPAPSAAQHKPAHGEFCHIVIPSMDLARSRDFYTAVFGWRVRENVPGPGYWFFENGVGGGLTTGSQPSAEGALIYIEVDDIPAALDAIKRHGGKVLRGKDEIGGGHGFDAHVEDPSGNRLGIHARS